MNRNELRQLANEIRYGSEGMKQVETTFLDRLKTEEAELAEKTEKLYAFFGTGTYKGLSKRERELLGGQYEAMTEYLAILGERIAYYMGHTGRDNGRK